VPSDLSIWLRKIPLKHVEIACSGNDDKDKQLQPTYAPNVRKVAILFVYVSNVRFGLLDRVRY
jgi:hypothetical protein